MKAKRILSVLLSLVMLMSFLPIGVMAADSITVYVSVAQNGEFVIGKSGETIAYVPVELDDQSPTIDDVFTALHEAYYNDGTNGYITTDMGSYTSITKFWGVSSEYAGYYNNNSYAMGVTDSVEDGAHLVFWFYQDTTGWSDTYTFFDKTTATTAVGTPLTLTLTNADYSGNLPCSDAVITVDGIEVSDVTTDAEGKASLSFEESGTYIVSAKSTNSYIVPPVCVVTVIDEGKTDEAYVAEDKEELSVTYSEGENITLPKIGKSGRTEIKWVSDNTCIDANTGVVTIPDDDTTVNLTATIWCNDAADTKPFEILVPGRLSVAKSAVTSSVLKPTEYTNAIDSYFRYDSVTDDTNILSLISEIINDNDINVALAENFTATDIIAGDGTITYPTDEAQEITLPLTLTFNGQNEQVSVSALIPKHAQTKAEAIGKMKAAMEGYMNDPKVLNGNTSLSDVKTTLLLPGGKTSTLYITWASSNEDVIKVTGNPSSTSSHPTGGKYEVKINRPNVGEQEATVRLTATFVYKTTSVMCAAGPMPKEDDRQISFDVKVPAVTSEEMQIILDSAASDIKITDKNGAVADLSNIKENLYFPSYEGYTTTWSTDLPIAIPDKGYDKSTVTRPVPGENASGTITLMLTKGETVLSKSFNATVLAWTESELEAERNKIQNIADALTFDEIKNQNNDAAAVTSNLYLRQNAKIDGENVTFNTYNSASYPYQITWTITPTGIITFNNGTGKVTTPLHDTEISLDAEISLKTPIAGVDSVKKTIKIVVSGSHTANSAESLEALLDGIAAQTTFTTNWESFMAMAAYEDVRPDSTFKLTDEAKQKIINTSLANINVESPTESNCFKAVLNLQSIGIDAKKLYPVNSNTPVDAVAKLTAQTHDTSVWSAPYTLLAYQQGSYNTGTKETELMNALVAAQEEDGYWKSFAESTAVDADTTGLAMLALAKYYSNNDAVKAALDKAIIYLSSNQLDNGGYDGAYGENANNAACVIMGLCAMGINPDTDARFIKNGNSVVDRLLDFAVESNDGFGLNVNDTTVNAYATQQGFPALVATYQVIKNGAAYNVYDFSHNIELTPGRATGESSSGGSITPPTGGNITVKVTIKTESKYWLQNYSVQIGGTDATVAHAFIKACDDNNITQIGAETGYVSSIKKGNETFAEFTNGPNSGWLYKVNNSSPLLGINEYKIKAGDNIVFYYTNDYNLDKGSSGWNRPTTKPKDEPEQESETSNNESEANKIAFSDVPTSHWAHSHITNLASKGILMGKENGFAPEDNITRAEFVTILARMSGEELPKTSDAFLDVKDNEWFSGYVAWAVNAGITSGVSKTEFAPNAKITRQDMAVMIVRFAEYMKHTLNESEAKTIFNDEESISDYAKSAVEIMQKAGIISGMTDGIFAPIENATRAQAAKMIDMLLTGMESDGE